MAKAFILFLIISNVLTIVHSARFLDQVEAQPQVVPTAQPLEENADNVTPPENAAAKPLSPTPATVPVVGAAGGGGAHEPDLAFFMHDVLGGSHPSARVVTGIVAQTEVNGIPFSKANNNIFPALRRAPSFSLPMEILTTPSIPTTFLSSPQANFLQPPLSSNSCLVQSLASSLDGTSQTLALTVLLHGEHNNHDTVDDAISFFGVHRSASTASQIAVVGGTGKYEHAKGYAIVETLYQRSLGVFCIFLLSRFPCGPCGVCKYNS